MRDTNLGPPAYDATALTDGPDSCDGVKYSNTKPPITAIMCPKGFRYLVAEGPCMSPQPQQCCIQPSSYCRWSSHDCHMTPRVLPVQLQQLGHHASVLPGAAVTSTTDRQLQRTNLQNSWLALQQIVSERLVGLLHPPHNIRSPQHMYHFLSSL